MSAQPGTAWQHPAPVEPRCICEEFRWVNVAEGTAECPVCGAVVVHPARARHCAFHGYNPDSLRDRARLTVLYQSSLQTVAGLLKDLPLPP